MSLAEYLKVALSAIGGSTALLLFIAFLGRNWIAERVKRSIGHEYDRKLAEFKGQLNALNRISQERWDMKKDIFTRALKIVDGWWSNIDWSDLEVEPDRQEKPTIKEIRSVHNQVSLICESAEVLEAFQKCFRMQATGDKQPPSLSMDAIADLRNAMRKELKFIETVPTDPNLSWVIKVSMKD